jgi:NNP family nitrate/nitrite transporter-like MFS transporter
MKKDPLRWGNRRKRGNGAFLEALRDRRVWGLFLIYGACFGVELTINNIAAIYYVDRFDLSLRTAGIVAGLFGAMNLFARSLGGIMADRFGARFGIGGRVHFLFVILLLEGAFLLLFSKMSVLPLAVVSMILFSICVQMAEGATFAVVPFVNEGAVGAVSGIVGAGGNVGAILAGLLFANERWSYPEALTILGAAVMTLSLACFAVRFSEAEEGEGSEGGPALAQAGALR